METIFINSENSKTSESQRLDLTGKTDLKDPKKNMGFSQFEYLLHL